MSYASIALLAIVQGLTEFLPVSSSGHLVLADALLGLHEPGVVTEVVLHLGTLLAVLIYFRGDLSLVSAYRCRHQVSKVASDHLPIIVDFKIGSDAD